MLPKISFGVTAGNVLPSVPRCSRGYRFAIDVSTPQKLLAYPSGKLVVLRELPGFEKSVVLYGHSTTVTSVRFSPSSNLLASGDESGQLRIWDVESRKEVKSISMLGGAVLDICWLDENRVIACGPCKGRYIRGIQIDKSKDMGEMLYHTMSVSCCDCTHSEPFYCISGSEDHNIGIFKGVPFQLAKYLQEHTNYVNDIKFSPSGNMFASGSGDRKLIIFDTKTYSKIKVLSDSSATHQGSIVNICWIGEDSLLTASSDKTCKLWNVKTGAVTATLCARKDKLEVADMFTACACFNSELILGVTFNGNINVWKIAELTSGSEPCTPSKIIEGHTACITSICYGHKKSALVSGDADGGMCIWREGFAKSKKIHNGTIVDIKEAADGNAYAAGTYKMLFKVDVDSFAPTVSLKLEAGPVYVAPSRTDPETVYVLLEGSKVIKVVGSAVKEEHKVAPNATALEISEDLGEAYVGDKRGVIHVYALKDWSELAKVSEYTDEITCLSYHVPSKRLAATDRLKLLYIYDIPNRKLIGNALSGHSGAIWKCTWSPEGTYLATASLDFSITVWDSHSKPSQRVNLTRIHSEGATCAAFKDETTVFTGGNDWVIKALKIEKNAA